MCFCVYTHIYIYILVLVYIYIYTHKYWYTPRYQVYTPPCVRFKKPTFPGRIIYWEGLFRSEVSVKLEHDRVFPECQMVILIHYPLQAIAWWLRNWLDFYHVIYIYIYKHMCWSYVACGRIWCLTITFYYAGWLCIVKRQVSSHMSVTSFFHYDCWVCELKIYFRYNDLLCNKQKQIGFPMKLKDST